MISIMNIPQLKDNYSYAIIHNKELVIIDPADSPSILKYIERNKLKLKAILITHHHADHTAGYRRNFKSNLKSQFIVPIKKLNTHQS